MSLKRRYLIFLTLLALGSGCIARDFHTESRQKDLRGPLPDEPERRNRLSAYMESLRLRNCADSQFTPEMLDASDPNPPGPLVEIPPLPPMSFPPPPPGTHSDYVQVPSGIVAVGALSRSRPTAVFVHGWSPCGQAAAFRFASRWHKMGWNAVMLRWHQGAFDPFNLPLHAEQSVWRSTGRFGVQEWKRLREALGPDYHMPITMITHSLGVTMTAFILQALILEDDKKLFPRRVDIIDPFVGFWNSFPADSPLYEPLGRPENLGQGMGRIFDNIRSKTTIIPIFHTAAIGLLSSSNFMAAFNRMVMGLKWRNPGLAHVELADMFFASISEPAPKANPRMNNRAPITAATLESDLRGFAPRVFEQIGGFDQGRYDDMEFTADYAVP